MYILSRVFKFLPLQYFFEEDSTATILSVYTKGKWYSVPCLITMPQLTSLARIELRLEQQGFTGAQANHQTKDSCMVTSL